MTKKAKERTNERRLMVGLTLGFLGLDMLFSGCNSNRDAESETEDETELAQAIENRDIDDENGVPAEQPREFDLVEEGHEIDEWYADESNIGPRPLPDHSDEFDEDDETEGGCYELPPELNCEPMQELEEFCFEPSEEEVELLYEATRLLQEALEAEAWGDCCLALEKLGELTGMVMEESIISNLLTIRLMAQIQGDLASAQAAKALLQHLGYGMTDLGMFFFEIPIDPSFGQPSPTDIPGFNFPPNSQL